MQRLANQLKPLFSKIQNQREFKIQQWGYSYFSTRYQNPSRHLQTSAESAHVPEAPTYLKTKKLTKTAAHIMQILDREAVAEAKALRPVPELRPGDVVQLKVEVPENKRRVSTFRGIVMAIRRSGIASTFRIRRFLAGVGVELLYPLYSPNIKELKVLEHRRVRRNKLYYMREKLQDKRNKIT
ncbi:hypothetical protein KP509_10G009000 [Ceratopteris richardii]|uniref:Ribosomal protein L19 n=2 Tax=Ceratopteris richardii TaxID=49495 RepID=A0A8T2TY91_CERRI|nr:hypothetical protein KP509_10G009000 [Ceratopteris richardii]